MQLEFEPWLLLVTLSAAAGLSLGALAATLRDLERIAAGRGER